MTNKNNDCLLTPSSSSQLRRHQVCYQSNANNRPSSSSTSASVIGMRNSYSDTDLVSRLRTTINQNSLMNSSNSNKSQNDSGGGNNSFIDRLSRASPFSLNHHLTNTNHQQSSERKRSKKTLKRIFTNPIIKHRWLHNPISLITLNCCLTRTDSIDDFSSSNQNSNLSRVLEPNDLSTIQQRLKKETIKCSAANQNNSEINENDDLAGAIGEPCDRSQSSAVIALATEASSLPPLQQQATCAISSSNRPPVPPVGAQLLPSFQYPIIVFHPNSNGINSPQQNQRYIQSKISSGGYVHTQIDYVNRLVPDLLAITNCSYYWGKMDRYEAERLLEGKPEGMFLLRDSAQDDHLFSVSFRRFDRSLHARIEHWQHRFSFDSHDPGVFSSPTVTGLIEHYKHPSNCMYFEPMLTKPLNRNFVFTLQHLARVTLCDRISYDTINNLPLPRMIQNYLREYHYRTKVRTKHFDAPRYIYYNDHPHQQQVQQEEENSSSPYIDVD